MRRPAEGGFSLLEVMVALAVLGMALVLLVQITTTNVRNTHHAKMVTIATFLGRAKMADLEDVVLREGFVDNDIAEDGDFSGEGRPEFRWETLIQKVQLPPDLAQQTQEAASEAMDENSMNPMAAMAGFMGGFMSTLIEPIRVGLEEAVRRVSVTVFWREPGRPERSFEVVTFMTDPAKLDRAVAAIGQPLGGTEQEQGQNPPSGSGAGGATGSSGSPGSGSGSRPSGSQQGSRR